MKWRVIAVGKPKLDYAKRGVEKYATRLRAGGGWALEFIKSGASREAESAELLRRSEGTFRIVLDERGEEVTSQELARKITAWELRSVPRVSLLIGGADGHAEALRDSADWLWSLSRLTMQHELALILTLEQVYRAYTIKAGLPYHRD